jgi:hypothetical protein
MHSTISGFDRGSGFRTAGVLVAPWAGTGELVRLRIVLKGRGALPAFIPGMELDDANPMGIGKNAGTGVFLDNFRLSNGYESVMDPLDADLLTVTRDVTSIKVVGPSYTLPLGARVHVWVVESGALIEVDCDSDGGFDLSIPLPSQARAINLILSWSAPSGGGRSFGPPVSLKSEQ